MAPIGNRVRQLVWARPARVRAAVAGVALLAVAAGAVVALRPDGDEAPGRARHRQYAGATESSENAGDDVLPPDDPASPTTTGDAASTTGPAPARGGAPTTAGAPGTTGGPTTTASAPGDDGNGKSVAPGGSSTSQPGAGSKPTTGGPNGTPGTTKTEPAGWAALPPAPIGARDSHSALWTGKEMVIWGGGDDQGEPLNDGAAYDPATRTWRKIPPAPFPPRWGDRLYWTGQEVLVFGGVAEDDTKADGAAWNPTGNTWRKIPASPLGARDGAVIEWAGDRLVVWSGWTVGASDDFTPEAKNDGAAYVPATDEWVAVGPAPIPPRSGAQSAWTGSRLIVTGGEGDTDDRTDGAAFDPATGTWSPIAARPEAGSCGADSTCTGLWTGTKVLFPSAELAYDPAANRWSAMAPALGFDIPVPGEPAVWTGRTLLTWGVPGGDDSADDPDAATPDDSEVPKAAGSYDPVTNTWRPLPAGPLAGRSMHTAVWTGEMLLVWGGQNDGGSLADGAAYRPD